MSEEEMKQTLLSHCKECNLREYTSCVECEEKFAKATNKALNLIDKLQKENEELKEENFDQVYMKAIADYKEKIRTKIKELENKKEQYSERPLIYNILKSQLEELLGE